MSTLADVLSCWESRIAVLRTMQLEREAGLLDQLLQDVRSAQPDSLDGLPLTPEQASWLSGYHRDHIRRMLVQGRWPNCGTAGRPRIRATDLPRKARFPRTDQVPAERHP